ncbi:heparinase II/III family protein [Nonomuraea sp. NPDC050643]|uniref:heparinase II/III domain-containing protein n=1 Tax=Nonomuraea sp. NPDC050643 TaxID=3155660 RepID=UPI0033C60298
MSDDITYVEKPPHVDRDRMRHISDEALLGALGAPDVAEARRRRRPRPVPAALPAAGADELLGAEVDFLDKGHGRSRLYGFHYLRWMSPLVTAYAETGDPRYAAEWDRLFRQWYDGRDQVRGDWPGLDVVWYSLGVRARAMYVTEALAVFGDEPALSDGCWLRMMKTVLGGARWAAEEHDAFRYGNWQFATACELLHTARIFADLPESAGWAAVATARVLEHLEHDVRADGGHHERSPGYHGMCLEGLGRAAAVEPGLDAHPRYQAMRRWLAVLATPAGWVPHLQDSGVVWLDGDLPADGSHNLAASGYATFRHDHFHTVVNYGPYVGHELEPHSHHAALDFVLSGWGVPLAWEGGGPPSYDDPGYYDWYQATRAHNTLLVPGEEYTEDRRAACDLFSVSPEADVFAGHHHGYGARHDREIRFVKGPSPYWVITDRIDAEAIWQIHGLSPWTERDGGYAGSRGPGLLVVPLDPPDEVLYGSGPARIPDPLTRTAEYGEIHSLGLRRRDGRFTVGVFPYRDEPPSVPDGWTVHAHRR